MAPAPAMVSASTGAMNSVLSKLCTLLTEEYSLQKGVRMKVKLLHDELTTMKDLLEKLAEKEDHDALVRGWMRQVREMTYDLDDGIDLFMLSSSQAQVLSSALSNSLKRFMRKAVGKTMKAKLQHQIAAQIEELKVRVREASERRSRYKLDDVVTSSSCTMPVDPRLSVMFEDTSSLVGINGQRDKLIELLIDGQQQLKVVPIVGCGGIGKTTLAVNVYRNIRKKFDCVAFVSVSLRPDIRKIFSDILHQVGAQAADEWKLIDVLREHLCHTRYLFVIDDVWSASIWKTIKDALPENNLGSRILVTTRKMSVAESCCYPEKGHIFQMMPLTLFDARALFFRRIFGSEEGCPPQFAKISNDILKDCGGLPFAIITMASLLARRRYSTQEWEEIRDSVHSLLYKDASMENMRRVLNLSYIDLPFHLKTCLLYLSIFPNDCVIDRKRLVRRWIAEGFISREHVDLEKVGEYYLNELIDSSLVQPVGIQYDGRVDACRVHGLILDLITSKSVEENFVTAYGIHEHTSGLQDKVRRLSLDCNYRLDAFEPSEITTSHVRSLTVIGWKEQMPTLENFRALRVLDVENYGEFESQYFKNIGRLYLLEYLRLHTKSVIQLPEEIGELQFLETLDLNGSPGCILPKSVVRLKKLLYLLVNNMKLVHRVGSIQSLQELSCVEIDNSSSVESLRELGNMYVLKAIGLNWCISDGDTDKKVYVDALVSSISKLTTSNLQSLCIESADGCSLDFLLDVCSISGQHLREFQMKSNYFFLRVPNWVSSLVKLTLLRINVETVGQEVMQTLGKLPSLLALFLTVKYTASEQGLIFRNNWFACLKQFDLACSNCRMGMLMFERGTMESLEKLRFVLSAQEEYVANGFLVGIEHLSSLRHFMAEIDCRNARPKDVDSTEVAIRNAVDCHPGRPSAELQRLGEQHMVKDERGIAVEDEEASEQNEVGYDGEHEVVVEGASTAATES